MTKPEASPASVPVSDGAESVSNVGLADVRLTVLAASIHALHFPSYVTWPPELVCERCQGKAGVHECGCWADTDREVVCGECSRRTHGGQFAWVNWPCATVRAVMGACDD